MTHGKMPPRCLTIAGSDSGGGAGIQGDLKTFTVLGAYGMSAITALTAQNTTGVTAIHEVPPGFVAEQIRVVLDDIGCDAAKTGMLANAAIVNAVAETLRSYPDIPLVVDPVMVSTTGARLLSEDAIQTLAVELIPRAAVVTPNFHEAQILAECEITDLASAVEAARLIKAKGAKAVLLKGGDASYGSKHTVYDIFHDDHRLETLESPRIQTPHTHGSGCALAAAICVELARGRSVFEAVQLARCYLRFALASALPLGHGNGPVNHMGIADAKLV
ncbi:MAG: bifunctional hydroxymethylpyrimidine kinase/phosphomethylpyrimidine kinase [Candidatus Sumerlaeaceae bacterium]